MTHRVIDCLVNVHFGETEKQPEFMLKVRDDYFKGPQSLYDQVELPAAARRDGRARRRQGHPDGQPGQAVGDGPQVRRGAAGQVRAGDRRHQPAAAGAGAARTDRGRQRPARGVCRCGTELLGRRAVPAERRRLLPAVRQVRRTRTAAVRQHRAARSADPRRGAEPDPPRPGVRAVPRTEAVHDPRRRPVVGRRDPAADQVREPAHHDVGVVAEAAAGQPVALHAHPRARTR